MALVEKTFGQIITFSRASSATFFNRSGVLSTATTNSPRFDYDPVTLIPRGILIEDQRTNLLTYSEQFDNAAWTKGLSSITADNTVSPDGQVTADKLVEDTSAGQHLARQTTSGLSSGSTLTLSVFLKAAERTTSQLYINDNATTNNRVQANFDLSAGTTSSASNVGTFTGATSSITSVGNGWYRCVLTGVATGVTSVQSRVIIGTTSYTGDGTSGIYIWGAQLEVGAFSTSYIPTVASTVTRSADVANINTLSPWFNSSEGTLFVEGTVVNNIVGTNARTYAAIGNVSSINERFNLEARSIGSTRARLYVGGSSTIATVNYNALGTNTKLAGAYGADGVTMCVAGLSPVTAATSLFGTVTSLVLGNIFAQTSTTNINGYLRRVIYYPRRLSNAELQSITA